MLCAAWIVELAVEECGSPLGSGSASQGPCQDGLTRSTCRTEGWRCARRCFGLCRWRGQCSAAAAARPDPRRAPSCQEGDSADEGIAQIRRVRGWRRADPCWRVFPSMPGQHLPGGSLVAFPRATHPLGPSSSRELRRKVMVTMASVSKSEVACVFVFPLGHLSSCFCLGWGSGCGAGAPLGVSCVTSSCSADQGAEGRVLPTVPSSEMVEN